MPKGRIKDFKEDRGFGFIVPDDGGPDLFFHKQEVNDQGCDLEPGAPVEYSVAPGRKPGEKKAVAFTVKPAQMTAFDEDGRPFIEPGNFHISVGGHQPTPSDSKVLTGEFEVY